MNWWQQRLRRYAQQIVERWPDQDMRVGLAVRVERNCISLDLYDTDRLQRFAFALLNGVEADVLIAQLIAARREVPDYADDENPG